MHTYVTNGEGRGNCMGYRKWGWEDVECSWQFCTTLLTFSCVPILSIMLCLVLQIRNLLAKDERSYRRYYRQTIEFYNHHLILDDKGNCPMWLSVDMVLTGKGSSRDRNSESDPVIYENWRRRQAAYGLGSVWPGLVSPYVVALLVSALCGRNFFSDE